jgi:hypothetical protein
MEAMGVAAMMTLGLQVQNVHITCIHFIPNEVAKEKEKP